MRIEARCSACSRRYLLDEVFVGTVLPCPTCGSPDGLRVTAPERARRPPGGTTPAKPAAIRPRPRPHALPGPVPAARGPVAPQHPSSAPVTTATSPVARALDQAPFEAEEIVCPRCKLHFVPRRGAAASAHDSARRTVLVVEDMELFRDIARDALAPRFEVKTAADLAAARQHLAQGAVDVIVLDPTLDQGESGVDLLLDLPAKRCPIVIYTDQDESEIYGEAWERLRRLGADDLVVKGLNAGEALARKVCDLLGEPLTEDE